MRRARGAVLVGLAVVAATTIVGMTVPASARASSASKPMSKTDFVKAADDVCRQANILLNDQVSRTVASLGGKAPTTAQLQQYVQQAGPIFQQELSAIRALVPPRADRKRIKKMLRTLAEEIADVEAHPEQLVSSSAKSPLFARSAKLAQDYGFKVCGTSNF